MSKNLLELATAKPVSTYTNPYGQINALIAQSGAKQIALEDMLYGSIRNPVPRVEAPGLGLLEYVDTGPLIGVKALAGLVGKVGKGGQKYIRVIKGSEAAGNLRNVAIDKHGNEVSEAVWKEYQKQIPRDPYTINMSNKDYAKHMKDVAKYDPVGNREALDAMLSKYGNKAHTQIRRLIDENRAIGMELPERAIPMENAIRKMMHTVEPDATKSNKLLDAWEAEEWKDFIIPNILMPLKKAGLYNKPITFTSKKPKPF